MKFNTIAIHGGYEAEATTRAAVAPIYQTTSYTFRDTQHGADLFNLAEPGNIYTRIMNPTTAVLEQRVTALEGGIGGLAMASGMAAITAAITTVAQQGDNVISSTKLYGGTYNLFAHTLPDYGIETQFCDGTPKSVEKLINDKTKVIFCESIGNPSGDVADLAALAKVANKHGVVLMVDNTVPTPYLCRPFEHGAHVVVHSLTKYLGGHGNSIGGIIVDSGKFPWKKHAKRHPKMTQPDDSYHGIVYSEALGEAAFIGRARLVPLRNTGAAIAPLNSFLILQGIETLPLRMDRHCDNALKIAKWLQKRPDVTWVRYAGLDDSPDKPRLDKYAGGKGSGILSFGIKGGGEAGARFIDALKLILRLVNIGDARSLACHPASTTHRQVPADELEDAGVLPDLVRLSIGIEDVDDLIADIEQALKAAAKKPSAKKSKKKARKKG